MPDEAKPSMENVIVADGRYPPEAFGFLHEGLARAVREVYGEAIEQGARQHVSGQQLCCALRELATERWGLLARTVLDKWNIRETIDFGNMVYLLIDHNFMKRTDTDSIEDFRDVFGFAEEFGSNNDFELKD